MDKICCRFARVSPIYIKFRINKPAWDYSADAHQTRILRFRVGLVGALWLSLQDYLRFVLTFPVHCAAGLGQKNTPLVSQRGIKNDSILFSVNWYPFISWWPFESRPMHQSPCAVMQSIFMGFPHLKTVFPFLFSDRYWVKSIESLLTCPCLFKYLY